MQYRTKREIYNCVAILKHQAAKLPNGHTGIEVIRACLDMLGWMIHKKGASSRINWTLAVFGSDLGMSPESWN